jgi:MerR family redox-sensitive transcriptional activator SoxR
VSAIPEQAALPLSIGEVAERAGLRTSAVRYYERVGLLPPPERQSGRRRYDAGVVHLLAAIAVAKDAGFSLREIEHLFHGFDAAAAPSARWQALAEGKLAELDALAARIEAMRELLRHGLDCGCLQLEDCELIAAALQSRT